jgi:hypothetical protein
MAVCDSLEHVKKQIGDAGTCARVTLYCVHTYNMSNLVNALNSIFKFCFGLYSMLPLFVLGSYV